MPIIELLIKKHYAFSKSDCKDTVKYARKICRNMLGKYVVMRNRCRLAVCTIVCGFSSSLISPTLDYCTLFVRI